MGYTPLGITLREIHLLLDAGLNQSQAAARLGCSQENISERLRRERDPLTVQRIDRIRRRRLTRAKRAKARAERAAARAERAQARRAEGRETFSDATKGSNHDRAVV